MQRPPVYWTDGRCELLTVFVGDVAIVAVRKRRRWWAPLRFARIVTVPVVASLELSHALGGWQQEQLGHYSAN